MLKLRKVFITSSHIRKSRTLCSKTNIEQPDQFYFTGTEEIIENVLKNFMMIGINLGKTKNVLTETSLEKLNNSIKNFDDNDDILAGILHGCDGNFCTGAVGTSAAVELSQNLMKTLYRVRKPIIAALDGYTTNFGLQLAMMCDIRVMDKSAMAGFQDKSQNTLIPPFLYERLVMTVGTANAIHFLCAREMMNSTQCLTSGLVNKVVDIGCALGQSMVIAQSIAFHNSLENIIEHRSKILSVLKGKT